MTDAPVQATAAGATDCAPGESQHSVAREWNDTALDAVRRDFPAPTVHARNLYHLSVAMWNAWTIWTDPQQQLLVPDTTRSAPAELDGWSLEEARNRSITGAAWRLLSARYNNADGGDDSLVDFNALLAASCLDPDAISELDANDPVVVGIDIAGHVLAATINDGANETDNYTAPYDVANEPLWIDPLPSEAVERQPMHDPNRWQPLFFRIATAQDGRPLDEGIQDYIGPHWGSVTPFALDPTMYPAPGLPIDPGPPPLLNGPGDAAFRDAVVELIATSARLDVTIDDRIDISPAARGNNTLGTDSGTGHDINPATGKPYEPNEVLVADWGRAIAEYWADGPDSETPPGHWNALANTISDHPQLEHRLAGTGPLLDRLEWDTRLYLALNAALHDAAIAAWGAKAHYDYARPVSMIRHMGLLGQSSDPDHPSHHPDGLPLVDDLIEIITLESTGPGQRHEYLADHIGEIAVVSWIGRTPASAVEPGGTDWILATEWLPFQIPTFVTPAFPAYVSGHSTFSRAAAEILSRITGDPYFPGGLGTHEVEFLRFEAGPSEPITLQWATYRDAADEAGQSRIWGGIHVPADDHPGRVIGHQVGANTWKRILELWAT